MARSPNEFESDIKIEISNMFANGIESPDPGLRASDLLKNGSDYEGESNQILPGFLGLTLLGGIVWAVYSALN